MSRAGPSPREPEQAGWGGSCSSWLGLHGENLSLGLTRELTLGPAQARKEGFLVSGAGSLHTQCVSGCPGPTQPRQLLWESQEVPLSPLPRGRLCPMHLSPAYLPWARPQQGAGEWAVDAGRRRRPTHSGRHPPGQPEWGPV